MVGDPNGVYTACMGHRDVIGADDTLENDLKFGVFFNPLDVLPSQVILDLVHE